jgi:hypothetical protein
MDRIPYAQASTILVLLGLCGCSSDAATPGVATGGMGGAGEFPGASGSGGSAVTGSVGLTTGGATGEGGIIGAGGVPFTNGGASTGGSAFGSGGSTGGDGGAASGGNGNTGGQGTGGAPATGQWTSRAIANPPSYMGSASGSSGCTTSSPTLGFEPADDTGGKHPLFLYFVGTTFSASDTSARYDSVAAKTVTEAMARRGFVSLSVQYDNTLSLSPDKVTCLYASSNAQSVLAVGCKLPLADCNLGIATWGHSQGALMAHIASQFEQRVRAVWTTGYSGGSYPLSNDRLRVVNGEADTMNGGWDTIKKAAGYGANECPNNGGSECLRPDGSGFVIVRRADCATSSADHCWFDRRSCGDSAITLEPNWTDKASTKAFALESNADWVAQTVARP